MNKITPYLHFMGNTEEAMIFYKMTLGGNFTIFQRFRDVPGSEKMAAHEQDKIIHISLDLGNGLTIMATDSLESMGQTVAVGNNFHICLHTDSESEADKIFHALSDKGKVEMPMNKTFFGSYFGMVMDKFGVQWMINYELGQANKQG